MLATTVIDPLQTSPTQAQRHDDDMAVTFPSSTIDEIPHALDSLTYSSSCSSEQHDTDSDDDIIAQTETIQELEDVNEEEDDETPFEQLMNRGMYLRQLRALALQDELERSAPAQQLEEEKKEEDVEYDSIILKGKEELCDHVYSISTNNSGVVKVLEYNSYLAHQRYYDDLKHVDITYMDFGVIPPHHCSTADNTVDQPNLETESFDGGRVVIEQRKHLGKGGFCWDAGFVLGEHVIAREEEWNSNHHDVTTLGGRSDGATVLELGSGTGLCGIMVGKATRSEVTVTDLPELKGLMNDNVRRNFGPIVDAAAVDDLSDEERGLLTFLDGGKAKGTVTSRVLRWGVKEDYFLDNQKQEEQVYDVIIGADIVASLYDPVALAQTLHDLCGPTTKIYISSKSRLDKPHEIFDAEMARLFDKVEKTVPCSRMRNPNVFIIQAEGKRDI